MYCSLKVVLVDLNLLVHGFGMSSLLIQVWQTLELGHIIKDQVNLAS